MDCKLWSYTTTKTINSLSTTHTKYITGQWDDSHGTKTLDLRMVGNCTLNIHFQFIIQNDKCMTYILIIFYISQALLNVSMHLHHLQGVLTLYFANVTKLLKLWLNKINRLKCSCDRCWMIKYNCILSFTNNQCKLVASQDWHFLECYIM